MSKLYVPFDGKGNLVSYPLWDLERADKDIIEQNGEITVGDYFPVTFKANYEFAETLTYKTYSRGCSSAKILFETSEGKQVEMFLTDFDSLMLQGGFRGNEVTGIFTFCKRGKNYGVKLVEMDT